MFRHSEIQRHLKARRLARERRERGSESTVSEIDEQGPPASAPESTVSVKGKKGRKTKTTAKPRLPDEQEDEEEEYAAYLRKESVELSRTGRRPWADASLVEDHALDYGDESVIQDEVTGAASSMLDGRRQVSYADVDEGDPGLVRPPSPSPVVKREFLWPKIG